MNDLPSAPATERNRYPILEQLKVLLPENAQVLEIGSGLGQHAVFFSDAMPGIEWQPSERKPELPSLEMRVARQGGANLKRPVQLDVQADPWPSGPFDVVFTANTAHIMSWLGVKRLFEGAAAVLPAGGMLIIYGPFTLDGQFTSSGNLAFDRDLRSQDPEMGLRDVTDIDKLGKNHHMVRISRIDMPANNMLLVLRRY
ncbi:MAG: DUF938 domain-containing protein [Xanthomonadales bacterium]|nr:DUF938 domain-containing protein [Gammaproteobacteria bacterium]NNE06023.1 DUF938 domain-containing protein [Xanthomonadales bacterium]NNL94696.1 DUF938 domain-containing protein [Xanthomonadales bacterium]